MRPTIRRLAAAAALTLALVATTASPASADEWTNVFFTDQSPSTTCMQGINATLLATGGLQFRSITYSFQPDCASTRTLNPGEVATTLYLRATNLTTGTVVTCGQLATSTTTVVEWWTTTGNTPTMSYSQIRNMCGIPAGHSATAGAMSRHRVQIWGTWTQTGTVYGTQVPI